MGLRDDVWTEMNNAWSSLYPMKSYEYRQQITTFCLKRYAGTKEIPLTKPFNNGRGSAVEAELSTEFCQ